jgi:predicted ATPase
MPEDTAFTKVLPDRSNAEPARFLGRELELELVRQLLDSGATRLLTLTGPAGVGKTSLALEVRKRLGDIFPGGIWFVDLTAIRRPADVPSALARSLGMPDGGPAPLLERLSTYLQARESLLILDNFEQVLPAAPLLDELLALAPGLKVLVTSRELLHLRAEQTLPVPPFAVPDPDHLPPVDSLVQLPSIALFMQRAQMVSPGFRLTDENARSVAELCVRLDGLPLAIELAAARIQLLSPQMMLERLEQRLSLLHWDAQDLPVRQHTLRSAIAWSYELLTKQEQALFRRLGIFVGGFTLEAAEAIAADPPDQVVDVLDALASLVDKSLVVSEEDGQGGHRFRLLESIRDYALEQMTSSEAGSGAARKYAWYFLELAERAAPELIGRAQRAWFLRLEQEHGNLRAALRWLLENDQNEPALRLAGALGYFWEVRGYLREGQGALEETLARVPGADPRFRAKVLNRLASLLIWQGEADRSRMVIEEALALGRSLDDCEIIARSLTQLGRRAYAVHRTEEDTREATQLLEEALALRQQLEDRRGAANIRAQLAGMAVGQGEYERAEDLAHQALETYREVGDDAGGSVPLTILGSTAAQRGDGAQAAVLLTQALEASSRL